ncbi:hypothetical protein AYI68_g5838 [Smittium mucronatum]|uniref:Uncharacterized protein n=1 Tax=Smittium mucronatum TaxID=133383 RepID=A0A1R0GT51_9FUNG|nr:hypothetical protein AYI68_g5838 [Smittium mucronatum]
MYCKGVFTSAFTYLLISTLTNCDPLTSEECYKTNCKGDPSNIGCVALCYGADNPDKNLVSETTECYVGCKPKSGDSNDYAECVNRCVNVYYIKSKEDSISKKDLNRNRDNKMGEDSGEKYAKNEKSDKIEGSVGKELNLIESSNIDKDFRAIDDGIENPAFNPPMFPIQVQIGNQSILISAIEPQPYFPEVILSSSSSSSAQVFTTLSTSSQNIMTPMQELTTVTLPTQNAINLPKELDFETHSNTTPTPDSQAQPEPIINEENNMEKTARRGVDIKYTTEENLDKTISMNIPELSARRGETLIENPDKIVYEPTISNTATSYEPIMFQTSEYIPTKTSNTYSQSITQVAMDITSYSPPKTTRAYPIDNDEFSISSENLMATRTDPNIEILPTGKMAHENTDTYSKSGPAFRQAKITHSSFSDTAMGRKGGVSSAAMSDYDFFNMDSSFSVMEDSDKYETESLSESTASGASSIIRQGIAFLAPFLGFFVLL